VLNLRYVIRQLGLVMAVLSLSMLAIALWAAANWSRDNPSELVGMQALFAGVGVGLSITLVAWMIGRRGGLEYLGRREALLLVAASWLIGAVVAALPLFVWAHLDPRVAADHVFLSPAAAYFEAMSGLTTTGATVLSDIESLPKGILLWRSMTHWLGGLGIVVLFVAVLPSLGAGGKRLFQAETSGLSKKGVTPRIKEAARALWFIYLGLTILCTLSLRATGQLGWFDSICHTFSMLSTGGLSTRNASIGAYDSVSVDIITIVFMLLAGVNFAVFFNVVRGRFLLAFKDVELRVYLGLKVLVIAIVTINIYGHEIITTAGRTIDATVGQALRFATFQTVSLHSGTGFGTADYELWPFLSRTLLVGLMFIGGCAGSTAGGIKVIRFWVTLKVMLASIERAFRPNVVRPIKVGDSSLDEEARLAAVVYFLSMVILFALGAIAIAFCEPAHSICDFQTAMSASVSTLCNVGPGLHEVGPTKNYGWFSPASHMVMSLLMCLGRLELYAIFTLLLPSFWRGE
jgi:trk system potassium uptake protein TrkH